MECINCHAYISDMLDVAMHRSDKSARGFLSWLAASDKRAIVRAISLSDQ